jgi:SAM-dependent methyltransferase
LRNLLSRNRLAINRELRTIEQRKKFSPALLAMSEALTPVLRENLRGRFIDIGCGEVPFKGIILGLVDEYRTLDIEERTDDLDYIGDVQDMPMIPDRSFDSAGCFGILEHVPDPARAAAEINRILKPGGVLIVTVPFLARIHEIPFDYYRYTGNGIKHLFENEGFSTDLVQPVGGIFSFLGHQLSTLLVCSVWHIPVLRQVVFTLNRFLVVRGCFFLDGLLKTGRVLPLGFLGVFKKP